MYPPVAARLLQAVEKPLLTTVAHLVVNHHLGVVRKAFPHNQDPERT